MKKFNHARLRVNDDILLTLCDLEDADALFTLIEKNRAYLRQWMGWLDVNTEVDATRDFIRNSICNFMQGTSYTFGIVYRDELVGTMGLTQLIGEVNLGYWLDEAHQGKGIITQTAKFLTDYALTELDVNRVIIRCATENAKSRGVPERLGFTHERTAREAEWLYDRFVDLEVYSFIRSDLKETSHA